MKPVWEGWSVLWELTVLCQCGSATDRAYGWEEGGMAHRGHSSEIPGGEREEEKKVSQFQTELISNESWDGMEWKSQPDLPRAALRRVSKHHWVSLQLVSSWSLAPDSLVRTHRWVISKTRSSTDSYKSWKGRFTWKSKPEWPPGISETSHWSKQWNPVVVSILDPEKSHPRELKKLQIDIINNTQKSTEDTV